MSKNPPKESVKITTIQLKTMYWCLMSHGVLMSIPEWILVKQEAQSPSEVEDNKLAYVCCHQRFALRIYRSMIEHEILLFKTGTLQNSWSHPASNIGQLLQSHSSRHIQGVMTDNYNVKTMWNLVLMKTCKGVKSKRVTKRKKKKKKS